MASSRSPVSVRRALLTAILLLGSLPVLRAQAPAAGDAEPEVLERLQLLEAEVRALRRQVHGSGGSGVVPAGAPLPVPPPPDRGDEPLSPLPRDREFDPPPDYQPQPLSPLPNWDEESVDPTVDVSGVFQLDAGWFHQDPRNIATVGDVEDGVGFRRTRLAAAGNVTEDVSYLIELDFAQSVPLFVDVWADVDTHSPFGHVRIGRFRQPFGMSSLTSVLELPFLERPLPFALNPFRQTGVMLYDTAFDENATWAVSGYRGLTDNYGNVVGDDGGYGTALRTTILPVYERDGDYLLHLGFDHAYYDPARDLVQFVGLPEFFVGQNPEFGPAGLDFLPIVPLPPFLNTGLLPTGDVNVLNVEAAAAIGRLYLQSEARWAIVDRADGSTTTFPAVYAHARYVLTGERLPYLRKGGVFGRIVPERPVRFGGGGGIGAWEVAARWSWLDLNAPNLPGPGRSMHDVTLGLNWYLNRYAKLQFDWIHVMLDDPTLGDSEADVYALRAQLNF